MKRSTKHAKGWDLASLQAYYQTWTQSKTNKKFCRDNPRKELPALLANPEVPATFLLIDSQLENLALWENSLGVHLVFTGDPAGWSHLRFALDFQEWNLRINRYEYAKALANGRSLSVYLIHGDLCRCFAQAVALKHDQFADWCGQWMVNELLAPTGFLQAWNDTPFHSLMAWLYATWHKCGISLNDKRFQNLGVYQPIVDGWNDDTAFQTALIQACDYHCLRSDPDINEGEAEFWPSPFDVFPGEILAMMRIRHELLGSKVAVSHPLLDSPFGSVPDNIPHLSEPILQDVADRVRRAEELLRSSDSSR